MIYAGKLIERVEHLSNEVTEWKAEVRDLRKEVATATQAKGPPPLNQPQLSSAEARRIDGIVQWIDCQEKEKASGKPQRFLWNTFACVEDLGRAGAMGARGADQPINKP